MVYVSTSCLKNPTNVIKVLQEYEKANIEKDYLMGLLEYANGYIIEKAPEGKDPDPKINAILDLLEEHFDKNKD